MTGYTFNQLFDFTRATAGTFVGSNGLIQTTPASINVLTFTQEFDNAIWSKIGLGTGSPPVVTPNAAIAPDGTPTADLVAFNRGAGNAIGDRSTINALPTVVNGATYVASIYIKAATVADIGKQVAFRGVAGVGYQVITLTADWVRISTVELSSSTTGNFELASRGTISADNQVSALLWGAQLELGSTATTYARNNGGLFPPRFDYDPVTLAPRGILIEEQRTNLLTYSEDFTQAIQWVTNNATVTVNASASPSGAFTADKIDEDTSTGVHRIAFAPTFILAAHTLSVFAKAAERNWIAVGNASDGQLAFFNLANGTIGTLFGAVTATITNFGNGWYRCTATFTPTVAAARTCVFNVCLADNVTNYAGVAGNGVFMWGAQLEVGTFATSYIPTVASQVTRTADVCNIVAPMFAPWYNQSAGTIFAEAVPYLITGNGGIVSANAGSGANRMDIRRDGFALVDTGGVSQASLSVAGMVAMVPNKLALAYQANDFALVRGGGTVSTDTSGTVPTVNLLQLGGLDSSTAINLNGWLRRVQFYPFRASNNQIQALTT